MKNKKLFICFLLIFSLFLLFSSLVLAASTPKIVNTIQKAFQTIEKWILTISTPAAAVAVCTGLFMQKFSFGEEERIRTGKRLVKSALFCYAFVLGIDLILAAIKTLVK